MREVHNFSIPFTFQARLSSVVTSAGSDTRKA
jgi:hypothetical protein